MAIFNSYVSLPEGNGNTVILSHTLIDWNWKVKDSVDRSDKERIYFSRISIHSWDNMPTSNFTLGTRPSIFLIFCGRSWFQILTTDNVIICYKYHCTSFVQGMPTTSNCTPVFGSLDRIRSCAHVCAVDYKKAHKKCTTPCGSSCWLVKYGGSTSKKHLLFHVSVFPKQKDVQKQIVTIYAIYGWITDNYKRLYGWWFIGDCDEWESREFWEMPRNPHVGWQYDLGLHWLV